MTVRNISIDLNTGHTVSAALHLPDHPGNTGAHVRLCLAKD